MSNNDKKKVPKSEAPATPAAPASTTAAAPAKTAVKKVAEKAEKPTAPTKSAETSKPAVPTKPELKAATSSPAAEIDAETARNEATKARILAHMNQDHTLALKDYLYHYGGVTATAQIASVTMVDLTSTTLVINYALESDHLNLRTLSIPLKPELASLSDAREVLVNMAKTAAAARGYSPFQIKKYEWVHGLDILVPATILWTVVGVISPDLVYSNPKSPFVILVNLVLKLISPLLPFDKDLIPQVAMLVMGELKRRRKDFIKWTVAIHLFEFFFLMRPLINKYRVPNPVKMYWYLACMIEGYPSIRRITKIGKKLDNQ